MAKRPPLSENSFLAHLFSPRKNPLPTGIRKRTLKSAKGRTKARVNSFNRMSPANQELLKRAGLQEAYLQGNATLKDARGTLRRVAVGKGLAKPLRAAKQAIWQPSALDLKVAGHITTTLKKAGYQPNVGKIFDRVPYMPEQDKEEAQRWKSGQIRAYGGDGSKVVTIEGESFNPLWYH